MRLRFALAPVVLSVLALGCSSARPDGDSSSEESELRSACTLGTNCPSALKLLAAHTGSTGDVRDEVTVSWQGDPEHGTTIIADSTSRKMIYSGTGSVVLSGNASGTAPVTVDDFILVEVIADSGEVLATGAINPAGGLSVDGVSPQTLAANAPFNGNGAGWSYQNVDITSLLPKNRSFRLRVGAYDFAGVALVSDVYANYSSGSTPPPPPPPPSSSENPWACSGTPLGKSDLLQRFAPGTSSVDVLATLGTSRYEQRVRTCNQQTGCTSWSNPTAVTNNDGSLAKLAITTTSSGGVSLSIDSASDSHATYDVSNGRFDGASHHSPLHDNVPIEGTITDGCIGWRLKTKQGTNGAGTWTETEFGVRGTFPNAVAQPGSVTTDVWACPGAPLSNADILRRMPAGGDKVDVLRGSSVSYQERSRVCNVATGCGQWSAPATMTSNDGRLANVSVTTVNGGGVQLAIDSASDSHATFALSNGAFSSSSFHTPIHDNVPVSGNITEGCIGWSMSTKTGNDGNGSWTERMFGVQTDFPDAVR